MAPIQSVHVKLLLKSLSPAVPNASIGLNYGTGFSTATTADLIDLASHVANSLSTMPSGGTAIIGNFIAPVIARGSGAILWDVYDITGSLAGSRMGSPVAVGSAALSGTPGTNPVPQETAATITLQAPYGSDVEFGPGTRPRARDRGRIYFGPLDSGSLAIEATTNRCLLSPTVRTNLTAWIKSINAYTSVPSTVNWSLCVWSRRNATLKSLVQVSVDDNPDTQRRRGGKAVAKTILSLP